MRLLRPDTPKEKTFAEIYENNRTIMRKAAYKLLHENGRFADDAVQEAFINMARNMDTLAHMDDQAIRVYAIKAVTTAAYRMLAKEGKYVPLDEDLWEVPDRDDSVLDQICCSETYQILFNAIRTLPDTYRDVLQLYYINRMELPEIARAFQMKYDTVKKKFKRGKQILIQKLEQEGITDEEKSRKTK